jgi:hypothetical protein
MDVITLTSHMLAFGFIVGAVLCGILKMPAYKAIGLLGFASLLGTLGPFVDTSLDRIPNASLELRFAITAVVFIVSAVGICGFILVRRLWHRYR